MSTAVLVILALALLSFLVLVHELGHFLAAKASGVWVEEFGLGLPPRLFGKKIGETIYSINALPIGGFVRLHGEVDETGISKPKRAFIYKPKKVRAFISLAGILANLLLGAVAFTILFSIVGIPKGVEIIEIAPDSPAEKAGILVEDQVLAVNTREILTTDDFKWLVEKNKGKEVKIELQRQEEIKIVEVKIREKAPEDQGLLGVVFTPVEIFYPPLLARPFVASFYGIREAFNWAERIAFSLAGGVIQGVTEKQIPEGIVGPVGILAVISEFVKYGILPTLNFIGLLSINLAILNLIPFPPLDGSRLLFIGAEAVFGKKILPRLESIIHTAGMIILILLLLLLTGREIPKLISAGSLSNFVNTIF
jgi:regulator of sigma E protease